MLLLNIQNDIIEKHVHDGSSWFTSQRALTNFRDDETPTGSGVL